MKNLELCFSRRAAGFILASAALVAAATFPAHAQTFPPITSQAVKNECGECHIAFHPQMLPRESWRKVIGGLSRHFGEDASLDAATTAEILGYYLANASDVSPVWAAVKWRRGLDGAAPLRVTQVPRFLGRHAYIYDFVWMTGKVKAKSNCAACHDGTAVGFFADNGIKDKLSAMGYMPPRRVRFTLH